MKRFKFRLQQVLEYRTVLRKEQERELALRNSDLFTAEEELSSIVSAQDSCLPPQQSVSMAEFLLSGQYQQRLRRELENQRDLVQEAISAVDAARDAYVEKAVEEEILETLREKKLELYKEERRRHERKELNELVVQRHNLRRRGNGGDENN